MSDQPSSSFEQLDPRIQRWIWSAGWTQMRDAQEMAVPAIVDADADVIIAAPTASGKTEAAFLPILTNMLRDEDDCGLVIYISPLKALINDQFGRMESLCEALEVPVWPWHGDIPSSAKARFLRAPKGVLLITPESLEATLCNRGFSVPKLFAGLRYMVVDELHAFIGTERGKQLQSLLHRVDLAIGRAPPRIGLSATLGDMRLASDFLRVGNADKVRLIQSESASGTLKVLIKGYVEPLVDGEGGGQEAPAMGQIIQHLFKTLRGTNNLIFPNSRRNVEQIAYGLRRLCEQNGMPNEFWPHHGSLSRELREDTEAALKAKDRPNSAVCTNTLELGIDIGPVKSVAQIGAPHSVASLRQRLGRSGRRPGESSILRGYAIEQALGSKSHLLTQLREGLFQQAAMVSLLLEGWFEPPVAHGLHLSTLVQQLLSFIAQRGGVSAAEAYRVLCATGPFANVDKTAFIELLRHLGKQKLIVQDSSGTLLHGETGEKLVNHYSFYAAFSAEEEYRVMHGSTTVGSLPVSSSLTIGDFILFAARTWRVDDVQEKEKLIVVTPHNTGQVPPFNNAGGMLHDRVRRRMRELYGSTAEIPFLDEAAKALAAEGRKVYAEYRLDQQILFRTGSSAILFTWSGDTTNAALVEMLRHDGLTPCACGPAIEILGGGASLGAIAQRLLELAQQPQLESPVLLAKAQNLAIEKYDWALPDALLMQSYASLRLDIAGAYSWIAENRSELGKHVASTESPKTIA